MTRCLALVVILTGPVLIGLPVSAADKDKRSDLQALVDQHARQLDAINKGDARALARMYARDVDVRFRGGGMVVGRNALEKGLQEVFARRAKGFKTEDLTVAFRFLRPDVALRTTVGHSTGVKSGNPDSGLGLTVLVKEGDQWLILASRRMVRFTKDSKPPDKVELTPGTTDPEAEKLARARARFYSTAANKKDEKTLRGMMHPDLKRIGPAGTVMEGRETALQQMRDGRGELELKVGSARFAGKDREVLIYDGMWQVTTKEATGSTTVRGLFTSVLVKNRDGSWQSICGQSMVPSVPPEEAKSAK